MLRQYAVSCVISLVLACTAAAGPWPQIPAADKARAAVVEVCVDLVIARCKSHSPDFSFRDSVAPYLHHGKKKRPAHHDIAAALGAASKRVDFGVVQIDEDFLDFLRSVTTKALVQVIAQPTVCTLSGRPCEFISGGEQALSTLAEGQFKPIGTTVRLCPVVLDDGKIYLEIEIEPQFSYPDPEDANALNCVGFGRKSERFQTSAELESGQTCIVCFHVQGDTHKQVGPRAVPFVGTLSHSDMTSHCEEELIVFATPHTAP